MRIVIESAHPGRLLGAIAVALGGLCLSGCGSGVKCVPVVGKVNLNGEPLPGGVLTFTPDASKGNTARVNCTAAVRGGAYEVITTGVTREESGTGAPPGWYKVTILANLPGQPPIKVKDAYRNVTTTPLSVEVVEDPQPEQYDLTLK